MDVSSLGLLVVLNKAYMDKCCRYDDPSTKLLDNTHSNASGFDLRSHGKENWSKHTCTQSDDALIGAVLSHVPIELVAKMANTRPIRRGML